MKHDCPDCALVWSQYLKLAERLEAEERKTLWQRIGEWCTSALVRVAKVVD